MPFTTLAAFAQETAHTRTVSETAAVAVEYAVRLTKTPHCGLVIRRPKGRVEAAAGSSDVARELEQLQADLGEGPGRDAVRHQQTVRCGDLRTDIRWPVWADGAIDHGILQVTAFELQGNDRVLGALDLFDVLIDDDHPLLAPVRAFVALASAALLAASMEENLRTALAPHTHIGQATGILMDRYDLNSEQALAVIRRYSHNRNISMHDVATLVIRDRELPPDDRGRTAGA